VGKVREHRAAITFDDPLSAAGQIAVRFSIPMVIAAESIGAEINEEQFDKSGPPANGRESNPGEQ
jgi:hypothetical protein